MLINTAREGNTAIALYKSGAGKVVLVVYRPDDRGIVRPQPPIEAATVRAGKRMRQNLLAVVNHGTV